MDEGLLSVEISPEEAAALLNDERNLARQQPNVTFLKSHNGSRGAGSREVPPMIRTLIGVAAHHDTLASTARAFGVSPSTVAQAKKGRVGVNRFDPELKETIDSTVASEKKDVRDVALSRLASMFESVIVDQNLSTLKVKDAVSAAKDLATVVDKLTPRAGGTNVAVFVHTPRVRDEAEYGDPIEVSYKVEEKPPL